ncbi:MAG: hypothetical protein HRT45_14675 [Bdellovibrionales bacterium]|nr:hypothetical protein [Bdellovibrionales bacterium]
MPKLSLKLEKELRESIYYLNVSELRSILNFLELPTPGNKRTLIGRILLHFNLAPDSDEDVPKKFEKYQGELSPDIYILPGFYSNGSLARARFKKIIGPHFSFTSYGMNWIRRKWLAKDYPTFDEFAEYWVSEFERRRSGGGYDSAKTNARVRFFRKHKGSNFSAHMLEKMWQAERDTHKTRVQTILFDKLKASKGK